MAVFFVLGALPLLAGSLFPDVFYFVLNDRSYLVFHNIAEIFSVIVSISIFGIGWYNAEKIRDRSILLMSCAFLAVGLLDIMHALSYEGMPDFFSKNTVNKAAQFWLFARFVTALALLTAASSPAFRPLQISRYAFLAGSLFFTALAFTAIIFFPALVPEAFLPQQGLTVFKKLSELGIVTLLIAAGIVYLYKGQHKRSSAMVYYPLAVVFSVLSETAFTAYDSAYDSVNLTGHIYKVIAFALIYRGLFITAIHEPYRRISTLNQRLANSADKHRLAEKQIELLSRDMTRIQEAERARTADELHESLSQTLVMATLALKNQMAGTSQLPEKKNHEILAYIRKALDITRTIASRLSPVHLKTIGIRLAIEDLLQDFNKTGKYRITADIDAIEQYFPNDWSIDFYRIVQESLVNIRKHSDASEITIKARQAPSGLSVTISDNGSGQPDAPAAVKEPAMGILIMRQRAKALGGSVNVHNTNPGFVVHLTLPASARDTRQL